MLISLCHTDLRSRVSILNVSLSKAYVPSSNPIVCAYLVLPCFTVPPRTSSITWDMKANPFSKMGVVDD